MRTLHRSILIALSCFLAGVWLTSAGISPVAAQRSGSATQSTEDQADPLVTRQSSVAQRYARLEELLLRLADVEASENPERAALLKRVAKQSREKFVLEKMRGASTLISNGQLSKALDDQEAATTELAGLLKLLMSEDRSSRIRDEKKRIAEIIKQLRLTERNERSVRARTENGVDLEEVAKEQKEITDRAEKLSKELDEQADSESPEKAESQEGSDSPQSEKAEKDDASDSKEPSNSSESPDPKETAEPKDAPDSEDQGEPQASSESSDPKESSDDAKPSEDSKPSDSKPSDSKPPSDSQPSDSQPSDSQSSEESSQRQDNPSMPKTPPSPEQLAEQQLKKAVEKMKEAQQKLAENQRGEATEQQRQAEEEIRKAIDRLEKILRQLREEEIQRELAKLESRLRKMAAMQSAVLDETVQLAKTPASQRNRSTDLKAADLSFEEQKITLEADRAMLLLREEGSSVAFPEVILQLREDTQRVATRLGQSKIDLVTQGIQNDILAALEEMIAALAKAQRENEKKQQEQQEGKPSSQGSQEQPLVQALAELKLIRTMQKRIQSTTDRYAGLLESETEMVPVAGDQTEGSRSGENKRGDRNVGEEVLPLLRDLAQRQDRLYQLTRDLVTKRNQ